MWWVDDNNMNEKLWKHILNSIAFVKQTVGFFICDLTRLVN